jgi:hypothetical protein
MIIWQNIINKTAVARLDTFQHYLTKIFNQLKFLKFFLIKIRSFNFIREKWLEKGVH